MLFIILFIAMFSPETTESGSRKPAGCDFFTRQNASKILGGDVTWTGIDSTGNEPKKWTCTFERKDAADGPKLYFGLHRFSTTESAREEFDAIAMSNKNQTGFDRWLNVGDEAIAHTDGSNFQFVMVRRGIRSFRIKVNPIGSTSLDDIKLVAQDLVRKIKELESGAK